MSTEYCFGAFRFNVERRQLTRNGVDVHLTPKAADTLLLLLRRSGDVVTKAEFIREVWRDAFVEDGTLTFHVHLVRKALGDHGSGQHYVRTVPRRGYRFTAPVHVAAPPPAPAPPPPIHERALPRLGLLALGALVAILVAVATVRPVRSSDVQPRLVDTRQLTNDRIPRDLEDPLVVDTDQIHFYPLSADFTGPESDLAGSPAVLSARLGRTRLVDVTPDGALGLEIRYTTRDAGELWLRPRSGEPRRIGDFLVPFATLAPDRAHVAYVRDTALWTTGLDVVRPVRLAQFATAIECPRWSPDGRRLRFVVSSARGSYTSSLWQVDADGSDAHPLLPGWDQSTVQGCGAWLGAGRGFVFTAEDVRGSRPAGPKLQARSDLWILPEGSIKPIRLTAGPTSFGAPAVSGDGSELYAVGVAEGAELVRFDAFVHEFVPYLDGLSARWINYSPDGRRIVYLRHPDSTIWQSNVDGTGARQLTFAPFEADAPAWSPDGRWVAMRGAFPDHQFRICLLPTAGGAPAPITGDDVAQGVPTWSPDSRTIAFGDVPARFEQPTGAEVIHLYDIHARTLSTLAGSQHLWSARWSHNGRFLAALTVVGQQLRIYDFQTGAWRALDDAHIEEMAWSSDDAFIYHTNDDGPKVLSRVRLSDGRVEHLTRPNEFATTPDWMWTGLSAEDAPIVLRKTTPTEVYALKLDWR